jgi:hypothetical protein
VTASWTFAHASLPSGERMLSARRMGKIEDMRRLREQQFADNDKRANDDKREVAKAATTKDPSAVTAPPVIAPRAAAPKAKPSDAAAADEGKCSVCGKMKALTNGLVASHQKGFGKACAGSRKEPA